MKRCRTIISSGRSVPARTCPGSTRSLLFVHRNVANLALPQDANYLSVLQFAVGVLKMKHIMVVEHYGCGGVVQPFVRRVLV